MTPKERKSYTNCGYNFISAPKREDTCKVFLKYLIYIKCSLERLKKYTKSFKIDILALKQVIVAAAVSYLFVKTFSQRECGHQCLHE
jgi:hypothetical protein